ncbi:MAG: hypothetical protein FD167_6118, partial [bacterium]
LDLSECKLYINEKTEPNFIFPQNTYIEPVSYFVLFSSLEKEPVTLSNSGATIELICNEQTIDYIAYPSGKNGDPSWQRKDNLNGFEKHPLTLFSPNGPPPKINLPQDKTTDSTSILITDSIEDPEQEEVQEEINETAPAVSLFPTAEPKQLIINEILASPSTDTNNDGVFKSDEDEFIEIVNISGLSLDISNLIISDNTKSRHVIPSGIVLENLEPLIIFGGGNNQNFQTEIKSQIASDGSLGLNNSGEEQIII